MQVSRTIASGSEGQEGSRTCVVRPKAPAVVEAMVRMASKRLVEELLGHKPKEWEYEEQRRYDELSRF